MSSIRKRIIIHINFFLTRILLTFPRHYFQTTENFAISLASEIKDLSVEVSSIYCKVLDKDESSKLKIIIKRDISSFLNFGKEFTEEMKDNLPWYFRIVGLILYPINYVISGLSLPIVSILIANMICDEFEKDGKINIQSYLYNFATGLNEGIEGTKKLSEEFKKSYEKK